MVSATVVAVVVGAARFEQAAVAVSVSTAMATDRFIIWTGFTTDEGHARGLSRNDYIPKRPGR